MVSPAIERTPYQIEFETLRKRFAIAGESHERMPRFKRAGGRVMG